MNFNLFNPSLINSNIEVQEIKVPKTDQAKNLDDMNLINKEDIDISNSDGLNKINSLDDNSINLDKKTITNKIDKQDSRSQDDEPQKDIEILKNQKSKSNFI